MPSIISLAAAALALPVAALASSSSSSSSYNVRAYQQTAEGEMLFPDQFLPEVNCKPNTGLAFPGGGSLAYLDEIGTLAALHKADLMRNVRYLSGISGGSWAEIVYSYNRLAVTDDVLLGPVLQPSELTLANLAIVDPKSARSFTNAFPNVTVDVAAFGPFFGHWQQVIQDIYMTPAGIPSGALFSYNEFSVADIKYRNPSLANTDFVTVVEEADGVDPRPYPIFAVTLYGPTAQLPITPFNRDWQLVEVTPLTAGIAFDQNAVYTTTSFNGTTIVPGGVLEQNQVGGLIEPFAFGLPVDSATGLRDHQPFGVVHIGNVSQAPVFGINNAASAASYIFGAILNNDVTPATGFLLLDEQSYWAPTTSSSHSSFSASIGDGGCVGGVNIMSLLQRGVTKIISFYVNGPLDPTWAPIIDNTTGIVVNYIDQVDPTLAAFFGAIPVPLIEAQAGIAVNGLPPATQAVLESTLQQINFVSDKVFPISDFIPVIQALQAAHAKGNGTIVEFHHTTVANPIYGIPAGLEVDMLYVYVDRSSEWENQLSTEVKALLNDPVLGQFPFWPVATADYPPTQANLLASYSSWLVSNNEHIFAEFLSREEEEEEEGERRFLRH